MSGNGSPLIEKMVAGGINREQRIYFPEYHLHVLTMLMTLSQLEQCRKNQPLAVFSISVPRKPNRQARLRRPAHLAVAHPQSDNGQANSSTPVESMLQAKTPASICAPWLQTRP